MGTLQEAIKFAKALNLRLEGKTDEAIIKGTLSSINTLYKKMRSGSIKVFEGWKKQNRDVMDWYLANYKEYGPINDNSEIATSNNAARKTKEKLVGKTSEGDEYEEPEEDEPKDEPTPPPKKKKAKKKAAKKLTKKPEKKATTKPKAKPKPKATKRDDAELSCYGHDPDSQRGYIDEALNRGTKRNTMIAHLIKEFEIPKKTATRKVARYTRYLHREEGIKITESDSGVMKGTASKKG